MATIDHPAAAPRPAMAGGACSDPDPAGARSAGARSAGPVLWTPSAARIAAEPVTAFAAAAARVGGRAIADAAALHAWSIDDRGAFWRLVWDMGEVIGDPGDEALVDTGCMLDDRFFPAARLNFAETLLRHAGPADALVFRAEDKVARRLSRDDLYALVSRFRGYLESLGIGAGDRVAAMMPNMPETVAAMLATASLGAVWSSCSPDFGVDGVIDRFGQIDPALLLVADGYWYGGKRIDLAGKIGAVAARLPTIRAVAVADLLGVAGRTAAALPGGVALDDALARFAAGPIDFVRVPFAHPLTIHFSSGTTAAPKCIIHSVGGTLLQHLKEHRLHCGLRAGDRFFYYTTCGWMMWNWLVSGLASGATLLLYDGSPTFPTPTTLFDYAEAERATVFGTSARFIEGLRRSGCRPRDTHDLGALRSVLSTGSPLSADGFAFVYDAVHPDVHLASIAGGTDIIGCFVLGLPTLPVCAGEIQGPGLGMAVAVWDDDGCPLPSGAGELVCTRAFPSMPVGFWNDPSGERYRATYFDRFPGVWCHGDRAEWMPDGGIVIHGRSDATLNPGGVRIGTAEVYAQLDRIPEVVEAVCIGQEVANDVRIVLFVRLADGGVLDAALDRRIRDAIRAGASPRHVPAVILAVADIPRTVSGKITELAVRDVVHGRPVRNRTALANPEALALFADRLELLLERSDHS